ncbi:MAG: DNA polymerase III subunit beta [Firmicutes bacterium]|nr:DNA polymerase III subunit beta [Bacillota bacterium]
MSIILSKDNLYRSLEIVGKALTGDSPIQALNNILMESDSRQLILSSTNLELEIKVVLSYEGDEPGSVLIPGRLTDIVRLLPAEEVQLDLNPDNLHIAVNSGHSSYNLFGSDPADFPRIEESSPSGGEGITVDSAALKEILKMVVFAASAEETRPAFNGVLFEFDGNRWSLISSDTYRLVLKSIGDQGWNFPPARCLVPAKALRELLRVLDMGAEEVTLFPSKDKLVFKFSSVYFAARLLNEKYPDISSVIPEQYSTRIVLPRHDLIDSVSRATLLAEGPNSAIQLDVADSGMTVRVSSQIGRMEETVPVEKEGEEIDLHINSRFVMDILKAASAKEIIIDFHGKSGPVIFRLPDDDNYLYLVLPIKMN